MEFPFSQSGIIESCIFTADFALIIGQRLLLVYVMHENRINRVKDNIKDGISCLCDAEPWRLVGAMRTGSRLSSFKQKNNKRQEETSYKLLAPHRVLLMRSPFILGVGRRNVF
jgi:hypothetical protein